MSEPPGARSLGSRLPALGPRGIGWFVLQLLLMALIAAAGLLAGGNWSGAARIAAGVAGAVLLLGGGALAFLGIRDLGPSLSPLPWPNERAQLVIDGVYHRLRHPIYAGVILGALGWSLLTASFVALVLTVALAIVLDLKSRREEAWLLERFTDYAAYASQAHRFVPGLY